MSKAFHLLYCLKGGKMNRIFLTAIFLFIFASFMSLNAQWAKTYGGSDHDWANSIQQTSDGGYIVLGRTNSFGFAYGPALWILKLSSAGDVEWQKIYGESNSDHWPHSIQQTMDEGYIVAGETRTWGTSSDIWVLKLSSEGDVEWQKAYGGNDDDEAHSIQQTYEGGYIVAGETRSWGAGGDIWVLKLSSDGDVEWQKTYGGDADDSAYYVQQTMGGAYIVVGNTNSFGSGSIDFWVLKLSPVGDVEWQKTYGGSDSDEVHSVQQTMDGGYIVAVGINVLKLSSEGDIEWQHSYGTVVAGSVQQTMDGGYIVAGTGGGGGEGMVSYANSGILKLSFNGEIEWQKAYGGGFDDHAASIQQTSDEGYIFAGNTLSFGISRFDYNFWIFKLSSNGELGPSCYLIKSIDASITDSYINPEDTNIASQDTNITPQETNISPKTSNATINNFCSGKYILSIHFVDEGTTDPSGGIHRYVPGTEVTIKATPHSGSTFYRWWGGDVPEGQEEDNPITIIMDSHKSIRPGYLSGALGDGWFGNWLGKKGGCFIATATYGSLLHPFVRILRDFRDRFLMAHKPGRSLVNLYYKYSPFAAELITKHKTLKAAVRINLLPLVAFSYSILHFGPLITVVLIVFIFGLPIFLVSFFRRKVSRVEAKDPKASASQLLKRRCAVISS
jgi:hypothetical protein